MELSTVRRLQDYLVPPPLERAVSGLAVRSLLDSVERIGLAEPAFGSFSVQVERDVAYGPHGHANHLDVYRPDTALTRPAVLYIHGGGFRVMSKETHALLARLLARAGYVVFNINYRLAPEDPFPCAPRDVARAYRWVLEHAADYGADPERLVVCGESSGANLGVALAVMTSYERPERWAREAFDLGVTPAAVAPICGFLQVSDPLRFARRKKLSSFVKDRLSEAARDYLPTDHRSDAHQPTLADPLCILEASRTPERALPPFFSAVGTRDPLLDDTRRLAAALEQLETPSETHVYPGELHAFHAFVWREQARDFWSRLFDFLARTVG